MEVWNGLSAISPGVDHKPVPVLDQAEPGGHLNAKPHDRPEDGLTGYSIHLGRAPDVIDRDHEHVDRRLRAQVTKCQGEIGAPKYLSRNLAGRDLTEDAGHACL